MSFLCRNCGTNIFHELRNKRLRISTKFAIFNSANFSSAGNSSTIISSLKVTLFICITDFLNKEVRDLYLWISTHYLREWRFEEWRISLPPKKISRVMKKIIDPSLVLIFLSHSTNFAIFSNQSFMKFNGMASFFKYKNKNTESNKKKTKQKKNKDVYSC